MCTAFSPPAPIPIARDRLAHHSFPFLATAIGNPVTKASAKKNPRLATPSLGFFFKRNVCDGKVLLHGQSKCLGVADTARRSRNGNGVGLRLDATPASTSTTAGLQQNQDQ